MNKSRVYVGAQTVFILLCTFAVYKILILKSAKDSFGTWLLFLSYSQIFRLFEFGIPSYLLAMIPKNRENAHNIYKSTFALAIFIQSSLAVFILSIVNYFNLFDAYEVKNVGVIALLAVLNTSLSIFCSINTATLDGLGFFGLRSLLVCFSWIPLLVVAFIADYNLTPVDIGCVFLTQIASLFALTLTTNFIRLAKIPISNSECNESNLAAILKFGYKYQLGTFAVVIIDPFIKYLLSAYASISSVVIYEVSNKCAAGLRSVFVSINQIYIYEFSAEGEKLFSIMKKAVRQTIIFVIGYVAIMSASSALISRLLLDEVDTKFISTLVILVITYSIDLISLPFYNLNIAKLNVKTNSLTHVIQAGIIIIGGFILSMHFGYYGVLYALMTSAIVGSYSLLTLKSGIDFSWRNAYKTSTFIWLSIIFSVFYMESLISGVALKSSNFLILLMHTIIVLGIYSFIATIFRKHALYPIN